MLGRKGEPPLMVSRFGFRGFMNIKHMTISLIMVMVVFSLLILYLWIDFFPRMEELNEETQGLLEESSASDVEFRNPPVNEIRILNVISLILFGFLDGFFALFLWKAKAPLRNEKILSPLFSIYSFNRGISMIVIMQLSIFIFVWDDPRVVTNLLYIIIPIFSVISLIIIVIVYKKVLRHNMGEDVVFKLPEDAGT